MRDELDAAAAVKRMQAEVLRAVRLDLDLLVRPGLTSPEARMAAQLASEMLAFLTVGLRDFESGFPGREVRLRDIMRRAVEILGSDGLPVPPAMPARELCDAAGLSAIAAHAAAAVAALLAMQPADAATRARSGAIVRDAVQAERDELLREHDLVAREMRDVADPVATVEVELTPKRVQAFVDAKLGHLGAGRVEHMERIPGGYSKDTFRLRLSGGLDGYRSLILRRDLPFGPGENSVVEEYELLRALSRAGLPVPVPLWCEADPQYAGRPFLLFPQYPGTAVFGDWHAPEAERHAVIRDVAQLMARLHSLDPFALGLAPRTNEPPPEVVRRYVCSWREKWRRRRVHPSVILETAFGWLERNVPASLPRVSLVHGDISFRNTLIHEGRLSVLLDWEFWHLGDPMEDLGYFRLVAEPYLPWDEFMQAYQDAGGEPYDPERASFYEIWRSTRNSTTTTTAWNGFLSGAYPASKAAYQGVSLYRLFLRDVSDKLQDARL